MRPILLAALAALALVGCPPEPVVDDDDATVDDDDCAYASCPDGVVLSQRLELLSQPQLESLCSWTTDVLMEGHNVVVTEVSPGVDVDAVDCGNGELVSPPDEDHCASRASTLDCTADLYVACVDSRSDVCTAADTPACQDFQTCIDGNADPNPSDCSVNGCLCTGTWTPTPTSYSNSQHRCVPDDEDVCGANTTPACW